MLRCCLFLFLFAFTNCFAQKAGQGFNDIIYRKEGFAVFSESLIHAVEQADTAFIYSRVDTNVFNGFGYNRGKDTFKRVWRDPYQNLSGELKKVLALGATYDESTGSVYAPYHFSVFPDSLDAFSYAYVLSNKTPVYASPDTSKSPTNYIPKQLIKILEWGVTDQKDRYGNPIWTVVQLSSGTEGFIKSKNLRSPIDYRFWFRKVNSQWHLMGWAAGD